MARRIKSMEHRTTALVPVYMTESLKERLDYIADVTGLSNSQRLRMMAEEFATAWELDNVKRQTAVMRLKAADAPKRGPGRPPSATRAAPAPASPKKPLGSWNWRQYVVEEEDGTQVMPVLTNRLGGHVVQVFESLDELGSGWEVIRHFWTDDRIELAKIVAQLEDGSELRAAVRLASVQAEERSSPLSFESIMLSLVRQRDEGED